MRHIYVAVPSYSSAVLMPTCLALVQAVTEVLPLGWRFTLQMVGGDADIARARNALLAMFLATDATDLVFIDADISWHPGDFVKLMEHGADFLAAVYRQRRDDEIVYPYIPTPGKKAEADPKSGKTLIQADFVPGGFWRLSRACIERMVAGRDTIKYFDPTMPNLGEIPWVFDFERQEGGGRLSEDFVFCKKWRDMGGLIWVDPTPSIDHTGLKTFEGNLGVHLLKQFTDVMKDASPIERVKMALAT
jgi:hypothetical protein